MTYLEFKEKYNGKFVDYDGQYGAQCWDLGQAYFTQVLGLPASVLGGCGFVSNMLYPPKRNVLDKYFYEIEPSTAKQGDVGIWEEAHIAIVDSNENGKLMYFSQNPNPCQVMEITNQGLHIFRLKSDEPTPEPSEYFVPDVDYRLLYDINLRLTPEVKNGNIPKVSQCDPYTKQLLTSKDPNANAVMKKGTEICPIKVTKSDDRTWLSYGNCWLCCLDKDGTRLIEKI